ncbi:MAG: hypothetical protein ACE5FU_08385, partial [Nitrospinota bacterium]
DVKFKKQAIGIGAAALELGKNVSYFLTDHGTALAKDENLLDLLDKGAEISVCSHSAEREGIKKEDLKNQRVGFATQFENAIIAQDSTRYLVF